MARWLPSFGRGSGSGDNGGSSSGSNEMSFELKDAQTRRASQGRGFVYAKQPYTPPGADIDRMVRDGYEKVIWVFKAIDAISDKMSSWPMKVMEGREPDWRSVDDDCLPLLNVYSNQIERSAKFFRYRLASQLLLSKKGVFVEVIPTRGGGFAALNLLPPAYTSPIPDPDTFLSGFKVQLPGDDEAVELPVYDPKKRAGVLWIRKPHPTDPYSGITPLEAAGISIDLDFYARMYNRNFLLNDGRAGQLVAVKGGLSPDDAAELKARFSPGMGGAGRTTVIEADAISVQDTAISPRDAQYAELRNITKEDLLIALGTPESVIGNASGRTFDNADAEKENWLDVTVLPLGSVVEAGFDVLTRGGWDDERSVVHDVSNEPVLLRAKNRRVDKAREDHVAGRISLDEFRETAELEPLKRPGSRVVWIPAGLMPVGDEQDEAAAVEMKAAGAAAPVDPMAGVGPDGAPVGDAVDVADTPVDGAVGTPQEAAQALLGAAESEGADLRAVKQDLALEAKRLGLEVKASAHGVWTAAKEALVVRDSNGRFAKKPGGPGTGKKMGEGKQTVELRSGVKIEAEFDKGGTGFAYMGGGAHVHFHGDGSQTTHSHPDGKGSHKHPKGEDGSADQVPANVQAAADELGKAKNPAPKPQGLAKVADGQYVSSAGTKVDVYPNGSSIATFTSGKTSMLSAEETSSVFLADGTFVPEGVEVPAGQADLPDWEKELLGLPVDEPAPAPAQSVMPPPPQGSKVYVHPLGKVTYALPDGTLQTYGPDGKPKSTSATAEKLAAGFGQWKEGNPPGWVKVPGTTSLWVAKPADGAPIGVPDDAGSPLDDPEQSLLALNAGSGHIDASGKPIPGEYVSDNGAVVTVPEGGGPVTKTWPDGLVEELSESEIVFALADSEGGPALYQPVADEPSILSDLAGDQLGTAAPLVPIELLKTGDKILLDNPDDDVPLKGTVGLVGPDYVQVDLEPGNPTGVIEVDLYELGLASVAMQPVEGAAPNGVQMGRWNNTATGVTLTVHADGSSTYAGNGQMEALNAEDTAFIVENPQWQPQPKADPDGPELAPNGLPIGGVYVSSVTGSSGVVLPDGSLQITDQTGTFDLAPTSAAQVLSDGGVWSQTGGPGVSVPEPVAAAGTVAPNGLVVGQKYESSFYDAVVMPDGSLSLVDKVSGAPMPSWSADHAAATVGYGAWDPIGPAPQLGVSGGPLAGVLAPGEYVDTANDINITVNADGSTVWLYPDGAVADFPADSIASQSVKTKHETGTLLAGPQLGSAEPDAPATGLLAVAKPGEYLAPSGATATINPDGSVDLTSPSGVLTHYDAGTFQTDTVVAEWVKDGYLQPVADAQAPEVAETPPAEPGVYTNGVGKIEVLSDGSVFVTAEGGAVTVYAPGSSEAGLVALQIQQGTVTPGLPPWDAPFVDEPEPSVEVLGNSQPVGDPALIAELQKTAAPMVVPDGYPYPVVAGQPVATALPKPKQIKAVSLRPGDVVVIDGETMSVAKNQKNGASYQKLTFQRADGTTLGPDNYGSSETLETLARTPHPTVTAAAKKALKELDAMPTGPVGGQGSSVAEALAPSAPGAAKAPNGVQIGTWTSPSGKTMVVDGNGAGAIYFDDGEYAETVGADTVATLTAGSAWTFDPAAEAPSADADALAGGPWAQVYKGSDGSTLKIAADGSGEVTNGSMTLQLAPESVQNQLAGDFISWTSVGDGSGGPALAPSGVQVGMWATTNDSGLTMKVHSDGSGELYADGNWFKDLDPSQVEMYAKNKVWAPMVADPDTAGTETPTLATGDGALPGAIFVSQSGQVLTVQSDGSGVIVMPNGASDTVTPGVVGIIASDSGWTGASVFASPTGVTVTVTPDGSGVMTGLDGATAKVSKQYVATVKQKVAEGEWTVGAPPASAAAPAAGPPAPGTMFTAPSGSTVVVQPDGTGVMTMEDGETVPINVEAVQLVASSDAWGVTASSAAPAPAASVGGVTVSDKAKAAAKPKVWGSSLLKEGATVVLPNGGTMVLDGKPTLVKNQGGPGYHHQVLGTPSADADPYYLTGDGKAKLTTFDVGQVSVIGKADLAKKGAVVSVPGTPLLPSQTPAAATPEMKTPAVLGTSGWKQTGGQGGSNLGGLFTAPDGTQFYVKKPKSQLHIENEVLAGRLYAAAGAKIPVVSKAKLDPQVLGGGDGVASQIVPGTKDLAQQYTKPAYRAKLFKDFALHAWLANWDAVGTGKDNQITDAAGDPVTVDAGGSLLFRAQGTPKGADFGDSVGELESLKTNGDAADVFGSITKAQQKDSFMLRVAPMTPDKIDALVDSTVTDPAVAAELRARLKARRLDMAAKLGVSLSELPENQAASAAVMQVTGGTPIAAPPGSDIVEQEFDGKYLHTVNVGALSLKPGNVISYMGDPSAPYVVTKLAPKGNAPGGKDGVWGRKNGTGPEEFLFVAAPSSGERQVATQVTPPPGWKPPPPPPPSVPGAKLVPPPNKLTGNGSVGASTKLSQLNSQLSRSTAIGNAYKRLGPSQLAALKAAGFGTQAQFVSHFSQISGKWDGSSNDTDPMMLAFHRAVAAEFGLDNVAPWKAETGSLKKQTDDHAKKYGAAYQAAARVMYEETQAQLKAKGITSVKVTRGMSFGYGQQAPAWAKSAGVKELPLRPLSSFAWTEGAAFGGVKVQAVIPVESIFSINATGPGTSWENEVVVIGVTAQWSVTNPAKGLGGMEHKAGEVEVVSPEDVGWDDATEDWLKPTAAWPFTVEDGDPATTVAQMAQHHPDVNLRVLLGLPVAAAMPAELRAELAAMHDDPDDDTLDEPGSPETKSLPSSDDGGWVGL